MSTFSYNKIIILQSLPKEEKQTGSCLAERLNTFAKDNGISFTAEVIEIHSLDDWKKAWYYIHDIVTKKGDSPIIHLEMHGCKEGIGIDKGTHGFIPYENLYATIQEVNIFSHNNIFFSMAVCEGMNMILSMNSVFKPMPFFGILASESVLFDDELLDNYTEFYTYLLKENSINEAEKMLYEKGEEAKKLKILTPEQIFANMYANYLSTYDTKEKCRKRAMQAAKECNKTFSSYKDNEVFIRKFINNLFATEDEHYKDTKKKFFMFDIYPEIEKRFDIPKTIDDFRKQYGLKDPSC